MPLPEVEAESMVVRRAAAGDGDAFERLVRAHHGRLHRIARRIVRDDASAEDVVQDTLVDIWRALPGLQGHDRFAAWSSRIVVRNAIAAVTRARRTSAGWIRADEHPLSDDPYRVVVDRDRLDRGLRRLPLAARRSLVLRDYAGLSPREIALVGGASASSEAARLYHARRVVRAAIRVDELDVVGGLRIGWPPQRSA